MRIKRKENKMGTIITLMTEKDWPDVARIYEAGIATRNATFQTEVPDYDSWDKAHRKDCRLVAIVDKKTVGWAALSNYSSRCVYSGVAEVSIYVDTDFRGQSLGDKLMWSMIEISQTNGIWTLQAGVFPENISSLRLHQKHGFRTIGVRERIGKLDGIWRDVVILERRSKLVGID